MTRRRTAALHVDRCRRIVGGGHELGHRGGHCLGVSRETPKKLSVINWSITDRT